MSSEEEDPEDIFDTGLSTIFDIPPIGFAPSSNGYYTYRPRPTSDVIAGASSALSRDPIQLRLPQPPPSLYNTLQANLVWPSGLYLSDLLSQGLIHVQGKNVVELGAGGGLPGIVALGQGAGRVVSTDWGVEQVLSVLEDNFGRACQHDDQLKATWAVVGHQWGTDPSPLLDALPDPNSHPLSHSNRVTSSSSTAQGSNQSRATPEHPKFDVILAADVLWSTSSHLPLLDSISALLSSRGMAHITAGLHTGRGPVERFLASAQARGMKVQRVREVRWREGGWDEYDESMAKSGEEERGVVVYFTLTL